MYLKYPDLELLDKKARKCLFKNDIFVEKLKRLMKVKGGVITPAFSVSIFSQIWGSTCTGFDVIRHEDGTTEPAFGGSAMTEEYTTVMYEKYTKMYVVFFGEYVCYLVDKANEQFLDDLRKENLAGLSQALKIY